MGRYTVYLILLPCANTILYYNFLSVQPHIDDTPQITAHTYNQLIKFNLRLSSTAITLHCPELALHL